MPTNAEISLNNAVNVRALRLVGLANGPPKNEILGKFYPSLGISQNFLMGLGVSVTYTRAEI